MRPVFLANIVFLLCLSGFIASPAGAQDDSPPAIGPLSPGLGPKHGVAMHGEPAEPADYTHLRYVNPDAPRGGKLVVSQVGTFDTMTPWLPIGRPMWFMRFPRRTYESLLVRSRDEPFTMYGLLAETVEMPDDRSWVAFTLREEARFADGSPLTVDDVLFSLKMLQEHGRRRGRYKLVVRADRIGERGVRFVIDPAVNNRELPLILGMMPVFSKKWFESRDFSRTSLEPPMGSGPYEVTKVEPGLSVTFRRRNDYWGEDLPINRGFNNFDEVRYDYYRDANTAFEAFKAGAVDIRYEPDSNALRWSRGYDFSAVEEGEVQRAMFAPPFSTGMLGFAINTRREQFRDVRVREALVRAFDFSWMNENYFFGDFDRTTSFFHSSDLAATGPATALEREYLAPFPDAVPARFMEGGLSFDQEGDYYARTRRKLTRALELFRAAGYAIRDGVMVNAQTGAPFTFEIMIEHPDHQRVALNYADDLKKIGIEVSVRLVDSSQFYTRSKTFDFDMMPFLWPRSLSPGNEQYNRWSSASADARNAGSYNFPGVKSPAIDAMIDKLVSARSREELVAATRVIDRVLVSGFYVVPLYHSRGDRIAWWSRLHHTTRVPMMGYDLYTWESWWSEP